MSDKTITLIRQLEQAGMPEAAFQALHHRGTGMARMQAYTATLKKGFRPDDTNDQLEKRLELALRLIREQPPSEEFHWYRLVATALEQRPLKKGA